jgi:HD-GYP domain-containing protein (c-di-GMP phosphodiesterase class II)
MSSVDTTSTADQSEGPVSINAVDLIVGRRIETPLFDENGILLLAEGSIITQEIKQNLKQRSNKNLMVSANDAKRITMQNVTPIVTNKSIVSFDSELTSKLDAIIDSGLLTVNIKGPVVKDSIPFLGRQGYNKEQREKLINQHDLNGKALSSMMADAIHGENIDGSIVSAMAADYLKEMTTDTDNVLTSVVGQYQSDNLAARAMETSLMSMAIGIEMGLDADNIRHLGIAGLVHDWGMMKVPAEIRNAERKLTVVEQLEIKKHPINSLEILQRVSALPRVISVVAYQVHEKINGQGYPRGRRGNSIHVFSRILQVADAFAAMTSPRPHRPQMMRYAAMECLIRMAKEKSVDPDVVRALLRIQSLFPISCLVSMSDGSIAQVIRCNRENYTRPIIRILQDSQGNSTDVDDDATLIDLLESELEVQSALPTPGVNEVPLSEESFGYRI